jgi:glycosyltransferase involved in cell wall biosynthesis
VCVCSTVDQSRLAEDVPRARTVVIPNAADVDYFQPRPTDPPPDGETVLFFGLLSTVPNVDGVLFFLKEVWPRIAAERPRARCKVVGANPPPAVRALAGPRVEITGVVQDLRPHLAAAAAVVVPLRIGSGTRLKIVEAWAMGKALVSTTLGAEGIDGVPERDLLIADAPGPFADSVIRLLDDPALRERIGQAARTRAVDHYSWNAAAERLTSFFREARAGR